LIDLKLVHAQTVCTWRQTPGYEATVIVNYVFTVKRTSQLPEGLIYPRVIGIPWLQRHRLVYTVAVPFKRPRTMVQV